MKLQDTFVGALLLKTEFYTTLRERSDVFLRGFLVLLIAGLIAGAFASLSTAANTLGARASKEQVQQTAVSIFRNNYQGPPAMAQAIEPYVIEIASMMYELESLSPRAGQGARPIIALLDWLGATLSHPFSWALIGWTLFAGLLFQLTSRWLGGRADFAQMFGLTALAAAPQVFTALTSLLTFLSELTGVGAFTLPNGLLGLVIGLWGAAIYVKATSVAQQFSIGRAIGAIVVGYVIMIAIAIVAAFVVAFAVVSVIGGLSAASR